MDYNRAITATQVVGQKRQVTDGLGNLFVYGSDELGRLIEVTQPVVKGQTPVMAYIYDPADNLLTATGPNNAVMTTQPDGTIIYTPFPDYELTDPPAGADTVRTTYRLGGQIVAVQTKVGAAAGTFYYTYTDHLGNISAMSTIAGVYVADSRAWYDPFGAFISDPAVNPPDVTPVPSSNPAISNHGFTGHRHNNTGTNNLGLIYMNARYYLPEIGRFISPDTIVPEPGNPQSFNRYAYVRNNPMNFTDPTGHRECGQDSNCQDILPGNPFQQALLGTWLYYNKNFNTPFNGAQSISQDFGSDHDGTDFAGKFTVRAPAGGVVSQAGSDSPAGIWKLQNKETSEIREWSQFCSGDGCKKPISIRPEARSTTILEPEGLLATGKWTDLKPNWSHVQGTRVEIQHEHNLKTIYYHTEVTVTKGMEINPGDIIGQTANNGWSTGSHLHYSLVWNYQGKDFYLNPMAPPSGISHLLP